MPCHHALAEALCAYIDAAGSPSTARELVLRSNQIIRSNLHYAEVRRDFEVCVIIRLSTSCFALRASTHHWCVTSSAIYSDP